MMKTPKTRKIWRLWRFSRFVWPRKAPLMEHGRLWKLWIPEIKVYQRKTGAWRVSNSKFCQENPKAGVINSWKWQEQKNTAIHDVIALLFYCHCAELRMHFFERIGWQEGWWSTYQQRCSFDLSWCITRIWSSTSRSLRWSSMKQYFDKEAFHEELRSKKLK